MNPNKQIQTQNRSNKSDSDLIQEAVRSHQSMVAVLMTRITNIKALKTLWESGEHKACIEALAKIKDTSTTVDFLKELCPSGKIGHLTLDLCAAILPIVLDLFDSQYEE